MIAVHATQARGLLVRLDQITDWLSDADQATLAGLAGVLPGTEGNPSAAVDALLAELGQTAATLRRRLHSLHDRQVRSR